MDIKSLFSTSRLTTLLLVIIALYVISNYLPDLGGPIGLTDNSGT